MHRSGAAPWRQTHYKRYCPDMGAYLRSSLLYSNICLPLSLSAFSGMTAPAAALTSKDATSYSNSVCSISSRDEPQNIHKRSSPISNSMLSTSSVAIKIVGSLQTSTDLPATADASTVKESSRSNISSCFQASPGS